MTSKERLDRLYRQREVDRPAVIARGVDSSRPAHESYAALRAYAMEHADIEAEWVVASLVSGRPDHADLLARVMPDRIQVSRAYVDERYDRQTTVLHTPMGPLEAITMLGKGVPPYTAKHLIASVQDARRYLSMADQPQWYDIADFFTRVRALGDRGIVLAKPNGSNPAGSVAFLLGTETFATWSMDQRPLLHELVAYQSRLQLALIKDLLAKGVGPYFGFGGQEYLTPPMHGAVDFEEFNTRYDRPISDLVHDAGGSVFIHCHGPLSKVLPLFIGVADALHPIEPPPMGDVTARQAKGILRGVVCIEGNLQIGDMYTRTAGEIAEMTQTLIADAFDDRRGLIVCPSASPYVQRQGAKAFETYRAMIDTVRSWKG